MNFYRNIEQLVIHSSNTSNANFFGCLVHILIKRLETQVGLLSSMVAVNSTAHSSYLCCLHFSSFAPIPLLYLLSYPFLLTALFLERIVEQVFFFVSFFPI
jgi:hypothetical protein